jgi:hypothetical protein
MVAVILSVLALVWLGAAFFVKPLVRLHMDESYYAGSMPHLFALGLQIIAAMLALCMVGFILNLIALCIYRGWNDRANRRWSVTLLSLWSCWTIGASCLIRFQIMK